MAQCEANIVALVSSPKLRWPQVNTYNRFITFQSQQPSQLVVRPHNNHNGVKAILYSIEHIMNLHSGAQVNHIMLGQL